MKRASCLLAALALPAAAAPPPPVSGGAISTLEQGRYTCELPGDALGAAGRHVPEADFTVISASSYRAGGTLGSYLLTGDRLAMTNGPHRGKRFHRLSRGFLRQVNPDGSDGLLRCVLGHLPTDSPNRCPDRPASEDPLFPQTTSRTTKGPRQASCAEGQDRGRG